MPLSPQRCCEYLERLVGGVANPGLSLVKDGHFEIVFRCKRVKMLVQVTLKGFLNSVHVLVWHYAQGNRGGGSLGDHSRVAGPTYINTMHR